MFNLSKTPSCIMAASKQAPTFKIQSAEVGSMLEIQIMDYIGEDSWGDGVSAVGIANILSSNQGRDLHLKINSLGGSFYEGLSMYNDLAAHDGKITATITGIAFSAATLPVMAADHVIMPEASDFGIHRAWTVAVGNAEEMSETVNWLESVDEHASNLYAAKSGATIEQVRQWLNVGADGTKFTAREALAAGFADEVIEIPKKQTAAAAKVNFRLAAEIQQRRIKARLGR